MARPWLIIDKLRSQMVPIGLAAMYKNGSGRAKEVCAASEVEWTLTCSGSCFLLSHYRCARSLFFALLLFASSWLVYIWAAKQSDLL